MDNIIVYVDDADCARQRLQALLAAQTAAGQRLPRRWILLGCAPRVTHRASKWVTQSARENWRSRWADRLFAQLVPLLEQAGDVVITQLAHSALGRQTEELVRQFGAAQRVDARRPKPDGPQPGKAAPDFGTTPVPVQLDGILWP